MAAMKKRKRVYIVLSNTHNAMASAITRTVTAETKQEASLAVTLVSAENKRVSHREAAYICSRELILLS